MAFPYSSGNVLTAADLNQSSGLVLVKTQTVGSAVSSVTVTGAFSSTFDNYRIVMAGVDCSATNNNVYFQLSGLTTQYYFSGIYVSGAGAPANHYGNNVPSFICGRTGTVAATTLVLDVMSPNLGQRTAMQSVGSANLQSFIVNGFAQTGTAFTAFVIGLSGGTMTGGKIRVYGYNNG